MTVNFITNYGSYYKLRHYYKLRRNSKYCLRNLCKLLRWLTWMAVFLAEACNFIKKETFAQVFFCEF